jgi:hypothetical protein
MQDAILHQFQEGNDELIQTLWDIIPQALARFSTDNSPLQGEVACYFYLVCSHVSIFTVQSS